MKQAAGILLIAADTKKLCLAWRSSKVKDGNRWGLIGGGCEPGESPKEAVLRELAEEVGYSGPLEAYGGLVDHLTGFEYHSFVGIVPSAFPFQPEEVYKWELDFIVWLEYVRFAGLIEDYPETFHKGVLKFYDQSRKLIHSLAVL